MHRQKCGKGERGPGRLFFTGNEQGAACDAPPVRGGQGRFAQNPLRVSLSRQECGKLLQAAGLFMDVPIYIDDTPSISPLELRAKARRMMSDQGLGLVVVDYLQLMRGRDYRGTQRAGNI